MVNIGIRSFMATLLFLSGVPLTVLILYIATELLMMIINYMVKVAIQTQTMYTVLNSDGPENLPKNYKRIYDALVKAEKV